MRIGLLFFSWLRANLNPRFTVSTRNQTKKHAKSKELPSFLGVIHRFEDCQLLDTSRVENHSLFNQSAT